MKDYAGILIAVLTHCFATVVSCPRLLMTSALSFSSELRPQTTSRRGTGVITARYFPNLLPRIALTAMVLLCLGVAVSAEAAVFDLDLSWRTKDKDGNYPAGYTYIKICVVSGSDSYRKPETPNLPTASVPSLDTVVGKVRDALRRSWEEHSSIRFIGWENCADLSDAQQKEYVGFFTHSDIPNQSGGGPQLKGKTDPAHYETVDGKQQLKGPGGPQFAPFGNLSPCIKIGGALDSAKNLYYFDCAREYAIHEFGHTIGFQHESPHPLAPTGCRSAKETVTKDANSMDPTRFTRTDNMRDDKGNLIFDTMGNPQTVTHYYLIPNKDFDYDSVMTYGDGCADVTGTRFGSPVPDQFDLQAVQTVYPPLPPSEFDVGVIPDSLQACPAEKRVTVYLDNEDDPGSGGGNKRDGWNGAIRSDRNTRLEFCRADGTKFGRHQPPNVQTSARTDYAVLKLGTTCPAGSQEFVREFDDENDLYNENWMGGDLGQNRQFGDTESRTFLHFCWFRGDRSDGSVMPYFPQLGYDYGVIGVAYNAIKSGWIYLDDENDNNHNSFKDERGFFLSDPDLRALSTVMSGDINTTIPLSLVRQEHAPTVTERSFTTDGTAEGNLLDGANDPDGDALTVEMQVEDSINPGNYLRPDHGTLDLDLLQKGKMLYTPDPGFTGTDVFTFQVTDGVHRSNLATVAIVTPPAPVLTVMLVAQPATSLSFRSSNGASFTLANRQRQDLTFRAKEDAVVTAAVPTGWYLSRIFCPGDPQAGINLGTGKVQVQLHAGQRLGCIYELGQTGSLAAVLYRDRNANGQYENATDTPLAGWSVQLYGQTDGNYVLLNEQNTDAQGRVPFTALQQRPYKVCAVLKPGWRTSDSADTTGQSCKMLNLDETALNTTIQLGLVKDDHAPVVADRAFLADGTAYGNLLTDASDPDGDAMTLALQPQDPKLASNYLKPAHGKLDVTATGEMLYTPNPGFTGTDTFTFQVTDGEMRSNVATASVQIPPAPVLTIALDASPAKAMSFRSSTGTTFTLANGQNRELTFQPKQDAIVTASLPTGWYLANIGCSENSRAYTDLVAGKVQISVHAAQRLSCTYQLRQYGFFEGLVYRDRNGNGQYDNPKDTPLAGWSVQLFNMYNGLLDEKTTDAQGKVRFASVPQGQYKLCEVLKPGWRTGGSGFVGGQGCKMITVSGGMQPQVRFGNVTP